MRRLPFRFYHQSSHLGDELLLSANHPERVNLSYESTELIYSRDWREWRGVRRRGIFDSQGTEWYSGYDPHGQFYNNKVDYFGLGVSLGF